MVPPKKMGLYQLILAVYPMDPAFSVDKNCSHLLVCCQWSCFPTEAFTSLPLLTNYCPQPFSKWFYPSSTNLQYPVLWWEINHLLKCLAFLSRLYQYALICTQKGGLFLFHSRLKKLVKHRSAVGVLGTRLASIKLARFKSVGSWAHFAFLVSF